MNTHPIGEAFAKSRQDEFKALDAEDANRTLPSESTRLYEQSRPPRRGTRWLCVVAPVPTHEFPKRLTRRTSANSVHGEGPTPHQEGCRCPAHVGFQAHVPGTFGAFALGHLTGDRQLRVPDEASADRAKAVLAPEHVPGR